MKKWIKAGVIAASLVIIGSGASMAADQMKKQDRLKDQKKDGSCKIIQVEKNSILFAVDQDRDRDRTRDKKKDGSCKFTQAIPYGALLAADQTRKQDRKQDRLKDGSCRL